MFYICSKTWFMNIISSIFKKKCPRCRQGDLFVKPFDIQNPVNMNERCEHCDLNFEPEPGYYFGAMFISYIWTAFFSLGLVGFCIIVLKWSVGASFGLLIFLAAISFFWIIRLSRSLYIHLATKYKSEYSKA